MNVWLHGNIWKFSLLSWLVLVGTRELFRSPVGSIDYVGLEKGDRKTSFIIKSPSEIGYSARLLLLLSLKEVDLSGSWWRNTKKGRNRGRVSDVEGKNGLEKLVCFLMMWFSQRWSKAIFAWRTTYHDVNQGRKSKEGERYPSEKRISYQAGREGSVSHWPWSCPWCWLVGWRQGLRTGRPFSHLLPLPHLRRAPFRPRLILDHSVLFACPSTSSFVQ